MSRDIGEINVKVKSEGAEKTGEDIKDEAQAETDGDGVEDGPEVGGDGGGSEGLGKISENTGSMLGMLGGIGIIVGLLGSLDGIKDILSGIMQAFKAILLPMAMGIMRLLGPLTRVMLRLLPTGFDMMEKKLGKLSLALGGLGGAIFGGVLGGAPGALLGAIIGTAIPIGVNKLMDNVFENVTVSDILSSVFPSPREILTGLIAATNPGLAQILGIGPSKGEGVGGKTGGGPNFLDKAAPIFPLFGMYKLIRDFKNRQKGESPNNPNVHHNPHSRLTKKDLRREMRREKSGETVINFSGGLSSFIENYESDPNVVG